MSNKTFFHKFTERLGYKGAGVMRSTSDMIDFESIANSEEYDLSEWLALEKAKSMGADYVFFSKTEYNQSVPIVYIYDETNKMLSDIEMTVGKLHRDIWSSLEVRLTYIFRNDGISILNTSESPQIEQGQLEPLYLVEFANEITKEIEKKYSAYNLSTLTSEGILGENTAHETLLSKLRHVREKFLKTRELEPKLVNKLLIQCVLIRFLEEKEDINEQGNIVKVFPKDFFQKIANANSFRESIEKGTFLNVFKYLNRKDSINGRIFEWKKDEEKELLSISSNELVNLLYETKFHVKGQGTFWDLYSFRFLPVEIISSIYEALFTTEKSVKENGMVYTPPHLAKFLVNEAMPLSNYNVRDFKILDPACGSGIFLVLSFKRLVHWWRLKNKGNFPNVKKLTEILKDSIHGVDSNENALLLTRFSLCLAVCDMLSPLQIWDELHFPDLDKSLICSDFFKWHIANKNNQKLKFDLVIGNPPFIDSDKTLPSWKEISDTKIPRSQIALYFLSASMRMVRKKGLLCLILKAAPLIYNSSGSNYRTQFFLNAKVHQIIDFTLLARNNALWNNNDVDTCALFATNELPDFDKNILHLVVKRTLQNSSKTYFEIDTYDFNWVSYREALEFDYIWKCNLLGGDRVFNLIKRLKMLPSINDYIKKQKKTQKWYKGEGYRPMPDPNKQKGEKKREVKPIEADYITNKLTVPSDWITENGLEKTSFPKELDKVFESPRHKDLFVIPHICIREVLGDYNLRMVLFKNHVCYQRDIVGISTNKENYSELENLFNNLKEQGKYSVAFILATSPRALVIKNSSLRAADIYNVPLLKINDDVLYEPNYTSEIIVDTICGDYRNMITNPKTTKMFEPIPYNSISERVESFSNVFCKTLNSIYAKKDKSFIVSSAKLHSLNEYIEVTFKYTSIQEDFKMDKIDSSKQFQGYFNESLIKEGEGVRFKRITTIYGKNTVTFIKPNQLMYWIDFIALRDADNVISNLIDNGH